jgi:hypothetical protein
MYVCVGGWMDVCMDGAFLAMAMVVGIKEQVAVKRAPQQRRNNDLAMDPLITSSCL